ncbi:transcriptional repressor [Coemansia nantahalensis]|uniref:Transcriptional repressor n=1 Tax=Coemansia nantahalensis TaxID=2789366 RepID=A0ACC1K6W3_9FUNG|nr:transcriptional repressor [Coemansia nantahalensis]
MSPIQTPEIDACCAPRLGLWGPASAVAARQPRSLSIRTANGHCVSILNDEQPADAGSDNESNSSAVHSDCGLRLSVPKAALPLHSLRRTHSASAIGLQSPCAMPTRLPSMSALVHAVTAASAAAPRPCMPEPAPFGHGQHLGLYMPPAMGLAAADCAHAGAQTSSKRKHTCGFPGCGKAFTTSGHLSRHHRIHTGEKNYCCLYPGCMSRFSRQDNMMQHYRTHLSPRSRRNRSMHDDAHMLDDAGALASFSATGRLSFSPYARPLAQSPPSPRHAHWPYF